MISVPALRRAWLVGFVALGCMLATAATAAAHGPYVYVTNPVSASVSQYAAGSGRLVPLVPPALATPADPVAIVATPDGRYVYATAEGQHANSFVLEYAVSSSGALLPLARVEVPGATLLAMAVSPNGRNVYIGDAAGFGSIHQYAVGPEGVLTPLVPATVPALFGLDDLAVSPDGRSVYIITGGPSIGRYSVGPGGALTLPFPSATPVARDDPFAEVIGLALNPISRRLYAADFDSLLSGSGSIYQYGITTEGALEPLSPLSVSARGHPFYLAITPDGRNLYATDQPAGTVLRFRITPGGSLVGGFPSTPAGANPAGLIIVASRDCADPVAHGPCGQHLYVANSLSNTVSQYAVQRDGRLEPESPPEVAAGANPLLIAASP